MTNAKLMTLVAEAVSLDREISEKSERLKELKELLVTEAGTRVEEQTSTEGGGASWTAEGSDGCVARVHFPAPSLRSSISEGKTLDKVQELAGSAFDRLFRPCLAYRPVDGFRLEAETLLGRAAGKLVRACESKSSPRVSFETKDTVRDAA